MASRKSRKEIEPDRHGAPHRLRAARHDRPRQPPAGRLHRRPQRPPAGAVQHLRRLPARAWRRRRPQRGRRASWRWKAAPIRCSASIRMPASPSASASSLEGNPALDADWPTYTLKYKDEAGAKADGMDLPMTFADFAATEARFGKQFQKAPPETWNDDMVPLADFLALPADEREGKLPLHLGRRSQEPPDAPAGDRGSGAVERGAPALLAPAQGRAGLEPQPTRRAVAERVRAELIAAGSPPAWALAGSDSCAAPAAAGQAAAPQPAAAGGAAADYEPCWVESPECTACDECIKLAPKRLRLQRRSKQAIVINPKGAKFADIVKAPRSAPPAASIPARRGTWPSPGLDKLHGARGEVQLRSGDEAADLSSAARLFERGIHPPSNASDGGHADPPAALSAAGDRAAVAAHRQAAAGHRQGRAGSGARPADRARATTGCRCRTTRRSPAWSRPSTCGPPRAAHGPQSIVIRAHAGATQEDCWGAAARPGRGEPAATSCRRSGTPAWSASAARPFPTHAKLTVPETGARCTRWWSTAASASPTSPATIA